MATPKPFVKRLPVLIPFLLLFPAMMALYTGAKKSDPSPTATFRQMESVLDQQRFHSYQSFQKELKTALQDYFDTAISNGEIVGAGVSIVQGDSVVLATGYGRRNIGHKEKVNGGTVFRLGSLSKGFGGILAADLNHREVLDWEDKTVDCLPDFRLGNTEHTDQITLANLLSHTSGAPYHSFTNLIEEGRSLDYIAKRFNEITPISAPGELYSYQNALFALSGEMMEKASGKTVNELLQQRFFTPLEMDGVVLDHRSLLDTDNVALPHKGRPGRWKSRRLTNRYENAVLAGGINASALDMGKWMRFVLGHNPEVLPPSAIQKVFKPRVEINNGRKYYSRWPGHQTSHYGFGWRIHTFMDADGEAKTIWHHGGSVNSYRNEVALYPEADMGICVLLNGNFKLAKTVIPDLYQIIQQLQVKAPYSIAQHQPLEVSLP